MRVDIWSDIACPWCYVGKRRFETALALWGEPVEVVWRSFQLDPHAQSLDTPYIDQLSRKFGPQAPAMLQRMTETGATEGISFDFARARPANTFDAHRLVHLSATHGLQTQMEERLFRAHFSEGAAIADHETLVRLAADVGVDAAEARTTLASDRFAREVQQDIAQAEAYGIRGVPFFVIDGKLGVSGAQSAEVLRDALAQAAPTTAADACGPDGCAI
jgi:predicted DsbA family dithiol-disulfide isomerase